MFGLFKQKVKAQDYGLYLLNDLKEYISECSASLYSYGNKLSSEDSSKKLDENQTSVIKSQLILLIVLWKIFEFRKSRCFPDPDTIKESFKYYFSQYHEKIENHSGINIPFEKDYIFNKMDHYSELYLPSLENSSELEINKLFADDTFYGKVIPFIFKTSHPENILLSNEILFSSNNVELSQFLYSMDKSVRYAIHILSTTYKIKF